MTTETKLITLHSAFNKTPGKVYHIMPCADQYGRMPDCVRRTDSNGDLILSEKDKAAWSDGKVFLPDNEPIHVRHGQTFDLDIPLQAAQLELVLQRVLTVFLVASMASPSYIQSVQVRKPQHE